MSLQTFYARPKGRRKMTDDNWVELLAERSELPVEEARRFWDAQKDVIKEAMGPDGPGILRIPGFGHFYRQIHKGHPLNLRNMEGSTTEAMRDYTLVKFKVTDEFRNEVVGTPFRASQTPPES